MAPNVFTIPPTEPFADALAAGLLRRADGSPEALARMIVLLPTRRACRAVREAFLRQSEGRPLLLPRLQPIGDVDEEELVLTAGEHAEAGAADIAPPISALRRRLLLAQLIRKFEQQRGGEMTPDQAAWLAADLARLIDEIQTERRDFAALAKIVPDRFAEHWRHTLKFLGIVTAEWPKILAEEGALDPAEHRNRLLAAQAVAWRTKPPAHPVIGAGSTGSIPATRDLLKVIASLPRGCVVLPGLDRTLDDATWSEVKNAPSHPQHGLARLLDHLEIGREEVAHWDSSASAAHPFAEARLALLAAALRPADAPVRRPGEGFHAEAVARAFGADVSYVECAHPREEAGAIAAMLREALDTPGQTAALVTPDRDLARRVAAALRRWNIEIDDSAGVPLAATPPVTFLRLVLDAASESFAPARLLAALKHPLAAGGSAAPVLRAKVRALERAVLRGPRPPAGLAGLKAAAINAKEAPYKVGAWLDDLARRWAPLTQALREDAVPVPAMLRVHVQAAEALATDDAGPGAKRLWAGDDGEAAARFIDELAAALGGFAPVAPRDYPELFEALLAGAVVRPRYGTHPRLAILGPLEARLQRFDLMVLGSLNEGTWPAAIAADPWMSRPMRQDFGLPLSERRIGLSAHDFAQAAMAPKVVLTRSLRQAGQPTRPSRWLLRIEAELEGLGPFANLVSAWRNNRYPAIARALDTAEPRPAPRPAPRPPVEARPRRLSVTQVEQWRRDPYAIYARHILKLEALDAIDADPSAAELGSAMHKALATFVQGLGDRPLPPDALKRLIRETEISISGLIDRPSVWAFWRPRFERIARWFVTAEAERRAADTRPLALEKAGRMTFAGPAGDFVLTGTADRIDRQPDGTLAIVDYKTGSVPKNDEIELGFAPQLPLEGAMAEADAFEGLQGMVTALEHWRLAGRDGGEIKQVPGDIAGLIADAARGMADLVARFDRAATPYHATPRPSRAPRFNDYVQLARTQEWTGR